LTPWWIAARSLRWTMLTQRRSLLIPKDGKLQVEVRGALGAVLRLAEGPKLAKVPTRWPAPCLSKSSWIRGQDLNLWPST
jgi:hypothetical protein